MELGVSGFLGSPEQRILGRVGTWTYCKTNCGYLHLPEATLEAVRFLSRIFWHAVELKVTLLYR